MLTEYLENANYSTFLPASIAVFAALFYFGRPKPKKMINEQDIDARVLAYKPEPLIEYSKVNFDPSKILEYPVPNESVPGCLNLTKVNYLNLLNNERLKDEGEACIRVYGVGSCGPRGFYGTVDVHLTLEDRIATFMEMEETVLYSYGFSTISSAIAAYCKKSDILFCDDKINFACIQGVKAAKSTVVYFKHNNMMDLELKLKEYDRKEKQKKKLYRKFLIVEGIYAATGTICPLPKLMELRQKYKLRIFIDESISFGVLGSNGKGITEYFNVNRSDVDMIMGSLENSVGSIGGFCVGASVIIEHQRLSGLGYCFSASLPPFLSKMAIDTLDIFENDPDMFLLLQNQCMKIHTKLCSLVKYIVISAPVSPLKVITTKNEQDRLDHISLIHGELMKQNIYLNCHEDTLQFHVNVTVTDSNINMLIESLENKAISLL